MNRSLAKASTLKGDSDHKLHAKALLGAAVVTAVASFFPSAAQAATTTDCASLGAISASFLTVTNIVCGGDAFGLSALKIELTSSGLAYLFSGDLSVGAGLTNGFISYDVAINPSAGQEFNKVQLSAEGSFATYTVTKDIAWTGGSAQLKTSEDTFPNPSSPIFSFAPFPNVKSLSIKDTWLATSGTVIDVNNGFVLSNARGPGDEVPGPLPIVGVAACFGLSRKLRSRIKASTVLS